MGQSRGGPALVVRFFGPVAGINMSTANMSPGGTISRKPADARHLKCSKLGQHGVTFN